MCSVTQPYLTLCGPMDYKLPGSSVHGILQARILESRPCLPLQDLPDSGVESTSLASPSLAGILFTSSNTKIIHMKHSESFSLSISLHTALFMNKCDVSDQTR